MFEKTVTSYPAVNLKLLELQLFKLRLLLRNPFYVAFIKVFYKRVYETNYCLPPYVFTFNGAVGGEGPHF